MYQGATVIETTHDAAYVKSALDSLDGFTWLYSWGMYLFLLLTLAIGIWIFFDSITKKKDQKALVPRILSIIGFFCVIPAFIFRFTGNADGYTTIVGVYPLISGNYTPYPDAIYWNVNWLLSGYGVPIAIVCLLGVVISIVAVVIYASTVQRAKPSTEFVNAFNNKMNNLEEKVDDARRSAQVANQKAAQMGGTSGFAAANSSSSSVRSGAAAATIIDRKPQAATIIDIPSSGNALVVQSGGTRGYNHLLPAQDVVIGRDTGADIVVNDGKASRQHARLLYNNGAWMVSDMQSANGTFVNDQRITAVTPLNSGDTLRIGDTVYMFS